jgi:glyoxylase-like metal-dependent hydrolase (beta-lactamase superfamily II)
MDRSGLISGDEGPMRVPIPAYLIEHAGSRIVFDAGLPPELRDRDSELSEELAPFFGCDLPPGTNLAERLRSCGVEPRDVDMVVVSHMHFDHVGGSSLVPEAELVLQRAEWEAAVADVAREQYVTVLDDARPRRLLEGEWDVFGDGRVVVVSTVGHTAGHQSLRLLTDDGREMILCGDACYLQRSLETRTLPPSSFDAAAQLASMAWLDERERSGARLFFGHEPRQWPSGLEDDRVLELASHDAATVIDLSVARAKALAVAREWDLELGEPFALANVSVAYPTRDGRVLKVAWEGDDESLNEPDALELWDGNGAVRLHRRSGRAILEERAVPGDDISRLGDDEATAIAVNIAQMLWRPATVPFRSVEDDVDRWIEQASHEGSALAGMARELFEAVGVNPQWVVHGDLHHHNLLRHGERYVAIDPKPYLADREYDVPSFLWNPMDNYMADRGQTERRIAAFVALGLDDFKIRAWSIIRGSYLRPAEEFVRALRDLIA